MKNIFLSLLLILSSGCAKHFGDITDTSQLELERSCFSAVKTEAWQDAKRYCTELIIVDDYHYGGWGQLCLAEYHLDNIQDAYLYCRRAIELGTYDDRIIHAYAEIEVVLADMMRKKPALNSKGGKGL